MKFSWLNENPRWLNVKDLFDGVELVIRSKMENYKNSKEFKRLLKTRPKPDSFLFPKPVYSLVILGIGSLIYKDLLFNHICFDCINEDVRKKLISKVRKKLKSKIRKKLKSAGHQYSALEEKDDLELFIHFIEWFAPSPVEINIEKFNPIYLSLFLGYSPDYLCDVDSVHHWWIMSVVAALMTANSLDQSCGCAEKIRQIFIPKKDNSLNLDVLYQIELLTNIFNRIKKIAKDKGIQANNIEPMQSYLQQYPMLRKMSEECIKIILRPLSREGHSFVQDQVLLVHNSPDQHLPRIKEVKKRFSRAHPDDSEIAQYAASKMTEIVFDKQWSF